jgi:formyl-CoA transferase
VKAPTYFADDLGGLHSALGALAALHHRNQTGAGQHVDVSMLDALLFQSNGLLTLGATGYPLPRWGNQLGVSVPCNTYACTDGYLYLAVGLDTHWRKLAELIGRPELATAPGYATNVQRIENRDAVNGLVADWCAERSTEDAVGLMTGAGLVASPVRTYAQAAEDPHVRERDMLIDVALSDGTTAPLTGPAVKFSLTPTTIRHGAPRSGTHTEEILTELGVGEEERAELRESGVI